MYHIFFIHTSVEGLLGYFQVLAATKNAAMNTVEQMSLWYECTYFGLCPRVILVGVELD